MPRPFISIDAVAAPLPIANVDTDQLVPSRFLKTVTRAGLGRALLHGHRFDEAGDPRPGFVLNREPWRAAQVLVAGPNFGCGSSREHAAWALLDFGIRVVIAPSIADIFRNNFIKNGGLPIQLDEASCSALMWRAAIAATSHLSVSLADHSIDAGETSVTFEIADAERDRLMSGADEIDASLKLIDTIVAFETARPYPVPSSTLDGSPAG